MRVIDNTASRCADERVGSPINAIAVFTNARFFPYLRL
jgi:hypothetical protein